MLSIAWDNGGVTEQQTPSPATPEAAPTSSTAAVSEEPTAGARRYPRTFAGLIASMLVLVIALVGFRFAQNATHDTVPADNMAVANWKGDVAQVQTVATPVYPSSVPRGWTVTSADWVPGRRPLWRFGVVTPDSQFVGIYQQQGSTADLVAQTNSSGGSRQTGRTTVPTALGSSWTTWTDAGGDHIYATSVGSTTVVVYGTDDAVVRRFLGLLTTRRLPKRLQNDA